MLEHPNLNSKSTPNDKVHRIREELTIPAEVYKSQVSSAFSRHAQTYDNHAGIQSYAANYAANMIANLKKRAAIPEGEVLEIGCGTGLFSSHLAKLFPERKIICSDISQTMLDACRVRLQSRTTLDEHVDFLALDAEDLDAENKFAVIASSFTIQWFFQPLHGLQRMLDALKPGGLLIFSVPGNDSCPEWKAAADALNLPFTRNPMPAMEQLQKLASANGLEFTIQSHFVQESYADAIAMMRSLKELGAGTQRNNLKLSCMQLRSLLRELDKLGNPLQVSYEIITGYYRRPYL